MIHILVRNDTTPAEDTTGMVISYILSVKESRRAVLALRFPLSACLLLRVLCLFMWHIGVRLGAYTTVVPLSLAVCFVFH